MDHCLGTYAWRGFRGEHRFLALQGNDGVRSTLEICIDHDALEAQTTLSSGQHSGPGNAAPTDAHCKAAKQLLELVEKDGHALRKRLRHIRLAIYEVDESGSPLLPEAWNLDMAEFCTSAPLGEIWRRFAPSLPGSLRTPLRAALRAENWTAR